MPRGKKAFLKEPFKRNLLDNRKQCFEKLDEDFIAVLQLKAYIVRLYPRQILKKKNKKKHTRTQKYHSSFAACSSF